MPDMLQVLPATVFKVKHDGFTVFQHYNPTEEDLREVVAETPRTVVHETSL